MTDPDPVRAWLRDAYARAWLDSSSSRRYLGKNDSASLKWNAERERLVRAIQAYDAGHFAPAREEIEQTIKKTKNDLEAAREVELEEREYGGPQTAADLQAFLNEQLDMLCGLLIGLYNSASR